MTGVLKDTKLSAKLMIICYLMYGLVYMGRINFTVIIVNIVNDGIFTKSQSGLIAFVFFMMYSIGQPIAGRLGDKTSPMAVICVGIFGAAVINLLMFFFRNFVPVFILYGLNGAIQSLIYPPLITIFAVNLSKKHSAGALGYLGALYPVSMIICTFLVVLFSAVLNYYYIFLFSALSIAAVGFLWLLISPAIVNDNNRTMPGDEARLTEKTDGKINAYKDMHGFQLYAQTGLMLIIAVIFFRGLIDSGTGTWVPTMIKESYGISPSLSQLLTVVLPLANLTGTFTAVLMLKRIKCEIKISILMFTAIILPFAGLLFIGKIPVLGAMALLFFVYIFKTVFFQMLNVHLPSRFAKIGKVSTVAGITNASASLGFAVAAFLFGFIAEKYGWLNTIYIWMTISAAGVVLLALSYRKWRAFKNTME